MNYIIIELQTNGNVTAIAPVLVYSDRLEAESKFHDIMRYAAISTVEVHSCIMMTEDGFVVRKESYRHPVVAVQEGE